MPAKVLESNASKAKALWAERQAVVSTGSAAYTSVVIAKAKNAKVWDVDGKEYIDFAGGIGAVNVGHCHPKVVAAIKDQAEKLLHTSFHVAAYEPHIKLCRKLIQATPGSFGKKALLFNSGSEAIENAVKFARAFTKRRAVISFDNAFHGRTLLCLTLNSRYKPLKQHFGPFASDIYHARFPNPYRPPRGVRPEDVSDYALEELDRLFLNEVAPEDVAALVVEPVQGEGGFVVPPRGFLRALKKICESHGILFVADEVQTGFGRTAKMFAIEHEDVVPDLLVTAKSLGAGMPLSAVVGRAEVLDAAPAGAVGGTYGGNPVSCAAALAVFDIFKEEKILDAAEKVGGIVKDRFDRWAREIAVVGDSRGLGAMRAVELVADKKTKKPLPVPLVKSIVKACEEKGLLLLKAGAYDNVLRTLMPLTIAPEDLDKGLEIMEDVLASARA